MITRNHWKRTKWSAALIAVVLKSLVLQGQVTPASFPPTGLFFTFDTAQALTNGWSTRSVSGSNSDITTSSEMDAAVQTNEVAGIGTALGTDSSGATPVGSASTSRSFRWNSARHFLESRPSGNCRAELLLAVRNDSGSDMSAIALDYDLGIDVNPGQSDAEDPGLYGHRVYYSLTGSTGSWMHIPQLDNTNALQAGPKHASITFSPVSWEVGANLYLLWVDDNGVPASTGTGSTVEGPYTIDNLSIGHDEGCPGPFYFECGAVEPHDVTVEQCRFTNLTVVATGTGPITYQWYKNGGAIPGATSPTLTFSNAQLSDNGTYFVRVTGPGANNTVDSTHVTVTVNQDTIQPTVTTALGRVDGTNVVVTFFEALEPLTATDPTRYFLSPAAGGAEMQPISAVLSSVNTVVTLAFSEARAAGVNHNLLIIPALADCAGNPLSGEDNGDGRIRVPLHYEIHLINFDNEAYKYDHSGIDLGIDWYSSTFDDSSWSNGVSVLDAKNTPRTTVGGKSVMTQLPLHYGNYAVDDVPVYYFRKKFNLPVGLSHISALSLRTFVDDFDVAYLNGNAAPVHVRAGLTASPDSYGYSGGTAVGDAGVEGPFNIPLSALVEGENVIAVKLFQQEAASSDITFAYELTAVVDSVALPERTLSIQYQNGELTIHWGDASALLFEADSPDAPPSAWRAIASGGLARTNTAFGQRFFSLRK